MIITIDGPAGSGKSTAARKLAAHLQIPYLDTGAMYRALAYLAVKDNIDLDDGPALLEMTRSAKLDLDCGPTHTRVRVNGEDVSEAIRTMEVSRATSPIARTQGIRDLLVGKQRELGYELGSFVTEGRDQGSVVFANADVHFVVDADLDCRAVRRWQELRADGEDVDLEEVRANLAARDANDAKQWAPLLVPGKAIRIDTSHMTIREVVACLVEHVHETIGK
ncbi:MAG: (d)CMP kinase [Phycisphaerales bacterium]|nr:(d)CMP kinase [Phycisphaerales bacterium]